MKIRQILIMKIYDEGQGPARAKEDPWHSQEMPDPYHRVFVRMPPSQICLDGARPTQNFRNFVRMVDLGFFWPGFVRIGLPGAQKPPEQL